jgi:hypothetical protein
MTNALALDEEQLAIIPRIEKLLRLAGSNPNQAEAASAAAKAQELLLAYNLDEAALGGAGEDGRRMEEKLKGGFYEFERRLWYAVAEINFCKYWTSQDWVERPEKDRKRKKVQERYSAFAQMYRKVTRHHLVGKKVSVTSTRMMVTYLLDTIERLTHEYISGGLPRSADGKIEGLSGALRSRRATSYREGIADTVASKLWARRNDQIAEERRKQAEEEKRFREAGLSDSTALTIASVRQSEEDANNDFLYGEGWSAKQRAQRAERARLAKEAEEEYTRWAAEHPEEARKQEEERRKEEKKNANRRTGRGSRGGRVDRDYDSTAYWAGRDKGEEVGIDPQAEHSSAPRKIAGRK